MPHIFRGFGESVDESEGTKPKAVNTVDGRNPFRTTWKPWETFFCWYSQGSHHSRVSCVVQDFVHPSMGYWDPLG